MPDGFGDSVGLDTLARAGLAATLQMIDLKGAENKLRSVSSTDGSERVSTFTKARYLILYFVFNLALTLFNKALLIELIASILTIIQLPSPFILTAIHASAGCIGTCFLLCWGAFTPKTLSNKDSLALFAFSVLYTANIAVSNLSLSMVSIPVHQVVRATTPVFTVAIYRFFFSSTYRVWTYLSLVPVIVGVGLATYGDYYATYLGLFMTLLGAVLAAIKTVVTNRMQTAGLRLTALELLFRLSPLAVVQGLAMAYLTGELKNLRIPSHDGRGTFITFVLINAAMSFGLNIASFTANKKVGALSMNVSAMVKQVLSILLSILFWNLQINSTNAIGIAITISGGVFYSYVEMAAKKNGQGSSQGAKMEEGRAGKSWSLYG